MKASGALNSFYEHFHFNVIEKWIYFLLIYRHGIIKIKWQRVLDFSALWDKIKNPE